MCSVTCTVCVCASSKVKLWVIIVIFTKHFYIFVMPWLMLINSAILSHLRVTFERHAVCSQIKGI